MQSSVQTSKVFQSSLLSANIVLTKNKKVSTYFWDKMRLLCFKGYSMEKMQMVWRLFWGLISTKSIGENSTPIFNWMVGGRNLFSFGMKIKENIIIFLGISKMEFVRDLEYWRLGINREVFTSQEILMPKRLFRFRWLMKLSGYYRIEKAKRWSKFWLNSWPFYPVMSRIYQMIWMKMIAS